MERASSDQNLRLLPLGGLGEFGLNALVVAPAIAVYVFYLALPARPTNEAGVQPGGAALRRRL